MLRTIARITKTTILWGLSVGYMVAGMGGSAQASPFTPTSLIVFGASQFNNLTVPQYGFAPMDDIQGTRFPFPLAARLGINGRNYALGGSNSIPGYFLGAVDSYISSNPDDIDTAIIIMATTVVCPLPPATGCDARNEKLDAIENLTDAGAKHIYLYFNASAGYNPWQYGRWFDSAVIQASFPYYNDPAEFEDDFADHVTGLVRASNSFTWDAALEINPNLRRFDPPYFAAYLADNLGPLGLAPEAMTRCYTASGAAPCLEHLDYGESSGTRNADMLVFNDGIHLTPAADQIRAAWIEIGIRTDMTDLPLSNGPNTHQSLMQKIVALRAETGDFNSYLMSLLISDPKIVGRLRSNGHRTVLMPTDAAFNLLGGTIVDLDDDGFLTEVMLYHILRGEQSYADILAATKLRTLQKGRDGTIAQDAGVLTDNLGGTAQFVVTDIEATNGVIHSIDAVLFHELPPD